MTRHPEPTATGLGHSPDDHQSLARVRTLDAEALLAGILEHTGIRLTLLGRAPGGQVGAAYVRWPDGRDGVLTWWPDGSPASLRHLRLTADLLRLARGRGIPVPSTPWSPNSPTPSPSSRSGCPAPGRRGPTALSSRP